MATTTSPQTQAGGWSDWNFAPSPAVIEIFNESLGHLIGVKYYDLIAYKEQLVNGANYKFICAAETTLLLPERIYLAEAEVYVPLKGDAVVKWVHEIGPEPMGLIGGWQNWRFPASQQAVNALNKRPKILGVNYEPHGSTSQVVAGVNYCLICKQTYTVPNSPVYAVLVYLYQALDGTVATAKMVPVI